MRKIDHLLDESQKKNKVHEADEILHLEMQNQDEGRVLLSKSKNNTKDVANQEDKGEKVQGRGGIIQGLGRSGGEYYRPYYSGLEESGLQNGMIAAQGQIMLRGQSAQKGERLAAESKSTVYIVSKESRSQSLSSQLSSSEKALVQSAKVIPSPVSEFSSQGGNIFPSSGKESENNKDQSVNQDVNKVNNDNEGGDEDTSESAATTPFTFNFWGHVNAAPGSWVSVYDSKNNFLKKARVRDDGTYFLKIDMDDAGTPEREGMRIGDPLIFRVGEKIAEPVPPAKGVCQGDGLNLTQLDLRVES
ncbi:MAG: hypothetical protein K6U11_04750 [bacterium]|nr:hypothetical protein [bacterium]